MRKNFIFLLFFPALASSQAIVWGEKSSFMEIGNKLEILEDETGTLLYEQVRSAKYINRFQASDKINLSLGYTESFFWLRFTIDNQSKNNLILEIAQAGLPITDLYYQNDNSDVRHIAAGYRVPVNDKLIQSSFQVFPLPTGKVTCYIRLSSNSEPIPVRLYSERAYETKSIKQKLGYGIYLGLMFFVVLINFFFFVSLKKGMHLFYSFIVLLYIGYSAAVIDGFIVYFVPQVDLIFLYTTIPAFGITIQTLYCLMFLEAKKYTPQLYKIIFGVVVYFGVWAMAKFFFSFSIVQPINTVNALISFFVMGYVGVKVGIKGNKLGYYFAIAYFIYFLLVALQAIYINTGSPEYIGGLSHVAYATLIEAFLLSFLLSKRSEWEREEIEKEKLEAQQKVIETTQEKERIVEEQNVVLEQEVKKRTEQLQDINEELKDINDKLVESSSEKQLANQKLTDQKQQLEIQHYELKKLNATKDRFFSIISHDLRNPVSAFKGLSSLVKLSVENKDYDQLPEMANRLDYTSGQLSFLLDNLLNWAVNQKGEFPFVPEKIDLKSLAEETFSVFQNMARSKEIKLEMAIKAGINILADRNSVLTIFRNLVSNAIKFTNKGGLVKVYSFVSDGMAEVKVTDTGIGIPKEKFDILFHLNEKKRTWGTGGEKGLGLGLRLAYEFATLNKGSIHVESAEGTGTTFIVKIPLFEQ